MPKTAYLLSLLFQSQKQANETKNTLKNIKKDALNSIKICIIGFFSSIRPTLYKEAVKTASMRLKIAISTKKSLIVASFNINLICTP